MAAAIDAFIQASGWQVGYSSEAARGRTSQPVSGTMAPADALRRIVAGSGIEVRVAAPGSVATAGAGLQGTPDWVYRSPTSTSVVSREAIEANPATRSAADTLDTVAGVMTNRSEAQNPGIAVMVRGLQDQNRVTTSIAYLERRKQYPPGARARGEVGTVYVRFRIDGEGNVLTTSLVGSSGFTSLDEAVLSLVRRASPVPAPPPEANRLVTVPINFK